MVILLAMIWKGYALADDLSENCSAADIGAKTSNASNRESFADVNSGERELIEEIVVIGGKKRHRPKRAQDSLDDVATPSNVEWQLFPAYDPERALQRLSLIPLGDPIRRAGVVTVFRISFGV
jgi:hypothetical protein